MVVGGGNPCDFRDSLIYIRQLRTNYIVILSPKKNVSCGFKIGV